MDTTPNDPAALKASRIEEKQGVQDAVKSYLNPHDRFAARMRAASTSSRGSHAEAGDTADQ